jgi:hypothetical protein
MTLDIEINDAFYLVFMALVPGSVGFAILRYRLYDIDYIINRTLVYGALTAFLAGLYAASLQLSKLLFDDVTGGSDAALVLTTLILAAAFTPAKNKLQKVVDRYFGQIHEGSSDLSDYDDELRAVLDVLDVEERARQFVARAVRSLDSAGGALYLRDGDRPRLVFALGKTPQGGMLRVPLLDAGVEQGYFLLFPRRDGNAYDKNQIEALDRTASLLARVISLGRRSHGASALPEHADELEPAADLAPAEKTMSIK